THAGPDEPETGRQEDHGAENECGGRDPALELSAHRLPARVEGSENAAAAESRYLTGKSPEHDDRDRGNGERHEADHYRYHEEKRDDQECGKHGEDAVQLVLER